MNFSQVKAITIPEGAVKQITDGLGRVLWKVSSSPSVDYTIPLYIEAPADSPNTNGWDISLPSTHVWGVARHIEYSFDRVTWTSVTLQNGEYNTYSNPVCHIDKGQRVYLRGSNDSWATNYGNNFKLKITSTGHFSGVKVGGNIMSTLYGENFTGEERSFPTGSICNFTGFFSNPGSDALTISDISELLLPATTMTNQCYRGMFSGCTSLTIAPALPATTLANYCYQEMFYGCTSLTTAPELPATTLANSCYYSMFYDCISLIQAPALPATTLANYCYAYMFHNCGSLIQAPELPATTLVSGCYANMFEWCSDLNYIKCLAVDDESYTYDFRTYCDNWVDGVNYSGTFIASDNYSQGWYWGMDGVPENWTTQTESGNYFEPTQEGGGGGTQLYQSNGLTVYEMGSEQGGYQVYADGSNMMFNDEYNPGFGMMKISADQGLGGNSAYMTPYLGGNTTVNAYISYEVPDDGTCPFSYSQDDEYDYEYALTNNDDGNQISPYISDGYCRWVKFAKPYWGVSGSYITMDF